MTFASTFVGYNVVGKYKQKIYTFTAASGDSGGTIDTRFNTIHDVVVTGELADNSAALSALSVRLTGTDGVIGIIFTDPEANAQGRAVVIGQRES